MAFLGTSLQKTVLFLRKSTSESKISGVFHALQCSNPRLLLLLSLNLCNTNGHTLSESYPDLLCDIEKILLANFLPAIFGCEVSALKQQLFSLPVRFGGLGVMLPSSSCESLYKTLWQAAGLIISAISGSVPFHPTDHFNYVLDAKCSYQHELDIQHEALFSSVLAGFDPLHQCALHRARVNDLSVWLSVLPTAANNFDLTAQEFRDAFAIRYKKPLLSIPPHCDGCGALSSLDHFLSCKKGGLIIQRHNEFRDAIGDLASLLWGRVRHEPIVSEDTDDEALVADLGIRGVWAPQTEALFDVRISDTDAQSYLSHAPIVVLSKAEADKKSKYCSAATARRAHFTPLCFSVDGLAGSEASCFLKRLAYGLSHRLEKNYPEVMFCIRANLAFALVRATGLCIRGTRTKWHHLGSAIIDEWTG